MSTLQVIDNAMGAQACAAFCHWLQSQPLLHGWRARADAPGKFWHRNFVLPGAHENHYDRAAVNPARTFERLLLEDTPLARAAASVSQRFFAGVALTRVWVNVQGFGEESAIHRDFPIQFNGTARTAVWYPMARWDRDWGGDFITLAEDADDEIAACVMVKPDRLVVFSGNAQHSARPISRFADELRIAVSFAGEVVND